MNNAEVKEFLRQYEYADKRAKILEEEYLAENYAIDAIRSLMDNDGMPHSRNISKPTEEKAIRLADKKLRLVEAKLEALHQKQNVFNITEMVNGIRGEVLFYRYIKLMKWEEVCVAVHKSWNVTHTYHREALREVAEILEKQDGIAHTRPI